MARTINAHKVCRAVGGGKGGNFGAERKFFFQISSLINLKHQGQFEAVKLEFYLSTFDPTGYLCPADLC